jgi:predicted transcriptional regulator of viral defense system
MDIQVRKAIPYEEVNTAMLRQALSGYVSPDDKIGDMVCRGELLRVRKGLYAIAPEYRQSALSHEILANTLYGPSYLSLEYALSWYGMIPERVTELTSVCLGRSRFFSTETGNFSYCSIKKAAYKEGYDLISIPDGRSFLMATREKALVDLIENRRNVQIRSGKQMKMRLLEDLRVDEITLLNLNIERVSHYASLYGSVKTKLLVSFLMKLEHTE